MAKKRAVTSALKKANRRKPKKSKGPLWKGPEVDGVTQSLLSKFLVCRERFRLLVVKGLREADTFRHTLEYGQLWHTCEEALAQGKDWEAALLNYARELSRRYPTQQEQVEKWYLVCQEQFPVYMDYWKNQKDQSTGQGRKTLLTEELFRVPYRLPSDRTVVLRGKWDSVYLLEKRGPDKGVWLQENKTKGQIVEEQVRKQLHFDLQTMFYLVALAYSEEIGGMPYTLKGVCYNVVRRPLSGGKHTIRQHKPSKSNPKGESKASYYKRLRGLMEAEPSHYFMRWYSTVSPQDIERFRREFFDPTLEQLADWWDWVKDNPDPFSPNDGCENSVGRAVRSSIHWRSPYGVYNVLHQGGSTELDAYLETGSMVGLEKAKTLFQELE